MKQETKNTINWIKECLNANSTANDKVMLNKAIKLLNSLPKLEARLLKGGYIPDKNGTPCKDGDVVDVVAKYRGRLKALLVWDDKLKCFHFQAANPYSFLISFCEIYIFEKVKDGSNNN